jgi:hypothetical protein
MNERIKSLVERAEYQAQKQSGSDWQVHIEPSREQIFEKFAELIVREMCSVLDKAQWDKGEDWVCADGTRIIPQIKDHFGVEE